MLKSLFTSLSGLGATSLAMGTIGNNIANVNTIGFKGSRNTFADLLASSIGNLSIGGGVRVSSTIPNLMQGSIITTGITTDLAIDGNGFFIVNDNEANYYTRAGNFILDKDGYLVTPEGYKLQGWELSDTGTISSTLGAINLANVVSKAQATTNVNLKVNLDARESAPSNATWWSSYAAGDTLTSSPPSDAFNYSTTLTVYDSLGNDHAVSIYFVKDSTTDNTWAAHYVYTNADGDLVYAGSQNLSFNSDGSLYDDNSSSAITIDFGGGAASQNVTFDYGTGTNEGGTGLDGSAQFSLPFSTNFLGQNGYPGGDLVNISIDSDGVIDGLFSNGQVKRLYQIALANFASPWNLSKVGDNLYNSTTASGQAVVGVPNTGGRGKILSGSLEMANVDLATEFTNMILIQRAFQANARVITTSDEMLTELVNLKR